MTNSAPNPLNALTLLVRQYLACLVVEAHRAVVSTVALIALFLLIAASSKTSIYDAANLIFTLTVRNRALYAQNSRPSLLCKKCLPAVPHSSPL